MENSTLIEIRPKRHLGIIQHKNNSNKTIFFLHGLGGRADQWRQQIDYFKADYNIIAPDLLGQGQSEKLKDDTDHTVYSFTEISKDIQAIFDRYHTEQNFIMGHSYGAAFASYLALQNTHQIQKMVLIAPLPLKPQKATFFKAPIILLELLRPWFTKMFTRVAFDRATDSNLVEQEIAAGRLNPMYVIKGLALGMKYIPNLDMTLIKQPTLIILGATDKLIPNIVSKTYYKKLPQVEFKTITSAAHLVILEQAAQVNLLIKNFL